MVFSTPGERQLQTFLSGVEGIVYKYAPFYHNQSTLLLKQLDLVHATCQSINSTPLLWLLMLSILFNSEFSSSGSFLHALTFAFFFSHRFDPSLLLNSLFLIPHIFWSGKLSLDRCLDNPCRKQAYSGQVPVWMPLVRNHSS